MTNPMVHSFVLLLAVFLLLGGCSQDKQRYQNERIGWEMRIPDAANRMSREEIERIRQQGEMLIGRAAQGGQARTRVDALLWFKFDDKNMFSSNLVSLRDISRDKYKEDNRKIHQLIKAVLEAQKVPHQVTNEKTDIGGKTFEVFTVKFHNNEGVVVATQRQYKRFFGDQELSVTLSFSDERKGRKMIEAWRNSKFD